MAKTVTNTEDVLHPSIGRDDLTEAAREPEGDLTGEGFGSYYPGPLVEKEDRSLLNETDAVHHPDNAVSVDPRRDVITGVPDPWANPNARDFRMDPPTYEPGDLREVEE